MSLETLVRDEVTGYGQHWVEVLRMGARVERGRWVERVPVAAWHLAACWERQEQPLDVYRFMLWWPAREMVRLDERAERVTGLKEIVLWYIEPGQTVRSAVYNAAATWWLERECWPGRVYLGQLPSGAPNSVRLEDYPEVELELVGVPWTPRHYLAVA